MPGYADDAGISLTLTQARTKSDVPFLELSSKYWTDEAVSGRFP